MFPALAPSAGLFKRVVSVALVTMMLVGCKPPDRWNIKDDPAFYPVSVDYWHDGRSFLVGSYEHGEIRRFSAIGQPEQEAFVPVNEYGHQRALRLRVDNVRNRVWVLDEDAVYVYTLPDRRVVARIALPRRTAANAGCPPDMTLDVGTGTAYIADANSARLHYIFEESEDERLVRTEIPVRLPANAAGRITALSLVASPHALIAGIAETGDVWRIDPATGRAFPISVPRNEKVRGVCAFATLAYPARAYGYHPSPDHVIYASTTFSHQIFSLSLAPRLDRGLLASVARMDGINAPLGMVVQHGYVVVASSQLVTHRDFGGSGAPTLPFRLDVVPATFEPAHALGP